MGLEATCLGSGGIMEGLCATEVWCRCTCQQIPPTQFGFRGHHRGLMCHWGVVPLYIQQIPPTPIWVQGASRRAYVPLGCGAAVHASGFPPLQFGFKGHHGGLMCHLGVVPLYMPADSPHSNLGLGPSISWRAYVLTANNSATQAILCRVWCVLGCSLPLSFPIFFP